MLPKTVSSFLEDAAVSARTPLPQRDESLFRSGVLDSFSLVEFVALVERECEIRVSDADVRPETFETIAKVEAFVDRARAGACGSV